MRRSTTKRLLSLAALICLTMLVSGCLRLFSIASGDSPGFSDNALRIDYQRSPEEAVRDFQSFVESNGMQVESMNGHTIKTSPGSFGSSVQGMGSGPEVRLVASAEATDGGSELTIVTEYLDPSAGTWERAKIDRSLLSPGGGRGSSDTQVMQRIYTALARRYGTENISHVSSDLDYSSQQTSSTASRAQEETSSSEDETKDASVSTASENADANFSASQTTRPGNGGDDTAWVQQTLNELGHDCGTADGVMGPNTRSCIRSFQKANGLDATGEVDDTTYEAMLERL
jgi:hypothetical protein